MPLDSAKRKTFIKALNKGKLGDRIDRIDMPWREHFQAPPGVRPGWGALYKPPLTKNAGDLQWRILHGIVAVNSFVLVLNPSVLFVCLGRQFFTVLFIVLGCCLFLECLKHSHCLLKNNLQNKCLFLVLFMERKIIRRVVC